MISIQRSIVYVYEHNHDKESKVSPFWQSYIGYADKMNRNRQRQLPQTVWSEQKRTDYRSTLTARLCYMLFVVVLKFELLRFSGANHPDDDDHGKIMEETKLKTKFAIILFWKLNWWRPFQIHIYIYLQIVNHLLWSMWRQNRLTAAKE